jgi:hypothetical protein
VRTPPARLGCRGVAGRSVPESCPVAWACAHACRTATFADLVTTGPRKGHTRYGYRRVHDLTSVRSKSLSPAK